MLTLTTPPTSTLINLSQLKQHLRIEFCEDDTYLTDLLKAASETVETDANCCIRSQVWRQQMACFAPVIRLRKWPTVSVTVQYYDSDNSLQTVDSADYYFLPSLSGAATVRPVDSWPTVYDRPDAVRINMTCGMTQVPFAAAQAVRLIAGAYYEQREAVVTGTIATSLPLAYQHLIEKIRYRGVT